MGEAALRGGTPETLTRPFFEGQTAIRILVCRRYAITSAAELSEHVAKLANSHGAISSRTVLAFATSTIRAQSGS